MQDLSPPPDEVQQSNDAQQHVEQALGEDAVINHGDNLTEDMHEDDEDEEVYDEYLDTLLSLFSDDAASEMQTGSVDAA